MATLLIAIGSGVAFLVAYHTYGRWLGGKIFGLAADAVCPSTRLRDDRDYVPTAKSIVFGHHFTSIAGTGPIVGPAIAVMWGWLPALLWVVVGSIFIGAVHDFGSLVVSLRNNGQTVGDIAGRLLNRRVRVLFLLVLFMALTIVLAIFGLVIAAVFRHYPAAIFPCLIQIPIAVLIGLWLHRRGVHLLAPSLIALALMYLTVAYGDVGWLGAINAWLADRSAMAWVVVLLAYSYLASVIPVWTLLQPRDYINSLQLISALGLIVAGLIVAAVMGVPVVGAEPGAAQTVRPAIVAPMIDFHPAEAPMIIPFLFITIACGAISGFHCLVSSGTSSKQLNREPDARFVGFGGMLTEGFLATIVILACVAGLGLGVTRDGVLLQGEAAWAASYSSWSAASGLSEKVGAFVQGAANFLRALRIDALGAAIGAEGRVSVALMGVLVASFAGTTLDTATRLQRYVVQELAAALHGRPGASRPMTKALTSESPVSDADADGKPLMAASEALPQTAPDPENGRPSGVASVGAALGSASGARRGSSLNLNPIAWLRHKHPATLFAVLVAGVIAFAPVGGQAWTWANAGKGGLILWPMFGATNQLLGGLAFLVIAFYLWRRNKPLWFLVLPLVFMLIMPAWAMLHQLLISQVGQEASWLADEHRNWPLIVIAFATLLLEAWMIVEAILLIPRARGVLEEPVSAGQPAVETVCC